MTAERKPWPMKWVALAILCFVLGYTYINLRYRKPASFEPYEDAKERARIAQVGYRRVSLGLSRPADGRPAPSASVAPAPGGLPPDLASSLLTKPVLPAVIGAVSAPPVLDSAKVYRVRFVCTPPSAHWQLDTGRLYQKGDELWIVVDLARMADELVAREPTGDVVVQVPPGALNPGRYHVVLVGGAASKRWSLEVH